MHEINNGNYGVRISLNGDIGFSSVLAVNVRGGWKNALVIDGKCHSTEAGALQWAKKVLTECAA